MASPELVSFCCVGDDHLSGWVINYQNPRYNVVCLASSVFSIVGTIVQLLPKRVTAAESMRLMRRSRDPFTSQKRIVMWLIVADLLACLGIFFRSMVWLAGGNLLSDSASPATLFCAFVGGWIQLFYITTYFWTFCYAVDVFVIMKGFNGLSKLWVYHLISWGMAVVLTGEGLTFLFYPSGLECEEKKEHLVPYYLSTYIPIVLVMILNPILYILSSRSVPSILKSRRGKYTDIERAIVQSVRLKFFNVVLVFFACWIPNVLNGVLIFAGDNLTAQNFVYQAVVHILWYMMAILNPLQAFLNSLVYRGWQGCHCACPWHSDFSVQSVPITPDPATSRSVTPSQDEGLSTSYESDQRASLINGNVGLLSEIDGEDEFVPLLDIACFTEYRTFADNSTNFTSSSDSWSSSEWTKLPKPQLL
ncbi:G-protein coupled receptor 143-like isoform X2 [Branchiostoma floridae]|uniref:G-protein coupled receptor 143-like isoform X2 n=2 Tax=Branchiostoma floridae TaxID=7739 RepID=A0A9J7KC35_BRAFL|nr:G-protein coupled receptor 143-like isoform X2 [Branchiostoma floridae]